MTVAQMIARAGYYRRRNVPVPLDLLAHMQEAGIEISPWLEESE